MKRLPFAFILVTAASAAHADFFDAAFPEGKDGRVACYARSYDAAHLKANPRQKVTSAVLDMEARNADGRPNQPDDFQLGLGLKARGRDERYWGHAYCKADADKASCFLEGDGGRITVTPAGDGRLRVAVGDYGLSLEGSDFLQVGADESDDNVFVLDRAEASACIDRDNE